jgi:GNAT superfamily N-acetyltransferase
MATAAFADDPAWRFLTSGEYERLAPEFVGALFDLRVGAGTIWLSDDLATVAMWESPGDGDELSQRGKEIWARYAEAAGARAHERLVAYKYGLAAAAPPEPYWYLGVLATDPARQREGLASAVLAPVLEQADRGGVACCLETSTEANRRFYERRGFIESADVELAEFPPTWWMRRAPRPPR